MDVAEQKFCNFKAFIAAQNLQSPLVSIFMQVPFDAFMSRFKEHVKRGITKKEAIDIALENINTKRVDWKDKEALKTFGQYINYFIQLAKIMP